MKINMKVKTKRNPAAAPNAGAAEVDSFRAQHMTLAQRVVDTTHGAQAVTMDDGESPLAWLAWLARRRGRDRDGRAMIAPHQLQAGERLRSDFTRAHMMPRTTSNWSSPISSGRRGEAGNRAGEFTDAMIASR